MEKEWCDTLINRATENCFSIRDLKILELRDFIVGSLRKSLKKYMDVKLVVFDSVVDHINVLCRPLTKSLIFFLDDINLPVIYN